MSNPGIAQILRLALQSLEETDALQVLGDLVSEQNWYDERLRRYNYHSNNTVASAPTSRWARAIVSLLLFDPWGNNLWPSVLKCHDGVWASHNNPEIIDGPDAWREFRNQRENEEFGRPHVDRQGRVLMPNRPSDAKIKPYPFSFALLHLEPNQVGTTVGQPYITIRFRNLIIPSDVCDAVEVISIRAANVDLNIGGNGLPGRMFSEEARPLDLDFPTTSPANTLQLVLQNISNRPIRVRAALYGIGQNNY